MGWALVCALAVRSSIVDASPFSTADATLVATADEEDRLRNAKKHGVRPAVVHYPPSATPPEELPRYALDSVAPTQ